MPGSEVALETQVQRGFWNNQFRNVAFTLLRHFRRVGYRRERTHDRRLVKNADLSATINVLSADFYRRLVTGGSMGAPSLY